MGNECAGGGEGWPTASGTVVAISVTNVFINWDFYGESLSKRFTEGGLSLATSIELFSCVVDKHKKGVNPFG